MVSQKVPVVGDDLAQPNGMTPVTEEGSGKVHTEMVNPERIQGVNKCSKIF